MPFKSEKQRRYLWKNHPEIAQRWENLYKSPTRTTKGFSPIQEITEAEVKQVEAEVKEAIRDEKVLGKPVARKY